MATNRTTTDPRPRRRPAQQVATPSSSPEFRAISPPYATQERAVPATAPRPSPRPRRQGRNTVGNEEQIRSVNRADAPTEQQPRQAEVTPVRRSNQNGNGILHSALRSNKKEPGSSHSVRISEAANPMDVDGISDDDVNPESSPLSEPLPRRARIRHSLLPRDQDGRLSVKADVMEQRARVIVTVATDAIQASLRKELADDPEGAEITWNDLEKIWEALDCKIFATCRGCHPQYLIPEFCQPTNSTSSTLNALPCSCPRNRSKKMFSWRKANMSGFLTRYPL